jgi:hypothetical protein
VNSGDFSTLDASFRAPPLSTEQILHPEKYLSARPDWPVRLDLDARATALDGAVGVTEGGPGVVDTNTLGEAGIRWLLETMPSTPRATVARAAEGWDGDRYRVWREDAAVFGAWTTTWDRAADAREFRDAITGWVHHASGVQTAGRAVGAGWTAWTQGGRTWAIGVEGRDVHVLIDVPEAAVAGLTGALHAVPRAELRTLDQAGPAKGTAREADGG